MLRILIVASCMLILGCGQSASELAQQPTQEYERAIEPREETVKPQIEEQEGTDEEAAEHLMHLYDLHFGAAVASLEERIYLSDVIVRANLVSAASDVLTFSAVEYLKGNGPTQFTVSATTANRNTKWDGNEAILFLSSGGAFGSSGESATTTFEFTDTTKFNYAPKRHSATSYAGDLSDGYTIDSANPVWAPSETQSGAIGTAGTTEYIEASKSTIGGASPTFSLDELRGKIAWVEGGEGITGYGECIQDALAFIRNYRDYEAHTGKPNGPHEGLVLGNSGAAPGKNLRPSPHRFYDDVYARFWFEGEHAALFDHRVEDEDDSPANGYGVGVAAVRPLPAGSYFVVPLIQLPSFQPCDFKAPVQSIGVVYKIILSKPVGTVYEALFDPNTTGFGPGGGKLDPANFAAKGKLITVQSLKYQNGKIVLETDPFYDLSGQQLDLIKLDGSVDVSLLGNSATQDTEKKELLWAVSSAPWVDGDKLMLRIWNPNATPPTPTPAPTATPSPTPTPAPTPTSTPVPAVKCNLASGAKALPWSVSDTALAGCSIGFSTARRIYYFQADQSGYLTVANTTPQGEAYLRLKEAAGFGQYRANLTERIPVGQSAGANVTSGQWYALMLLGTSDGQTIMGSVSGSNGLTSIR